MKHKPKLPPRVRQNMTEPQTEFTKNIKLEQVEQMPAKNKPKIRAVNSEADIEAFANFRQELKIILSKKNRRTKKSGKRNMLEVLEDEGRDKALAERIFWLSAKGYPKDEMRKILGLSYSQWHLMMSKYAEEFPIYKLAYAKGDEHASEEYVVAAKNRALGYDYFEETWDERFGYKKVKKHVPGDPKLIMFMLENKKPDEYKRRRYEDINITQTNNDEVDLTKLSPEKLKMLLESDAIKDEVVKNLPSVDEE